MISIPESVSSSIVARSLGGPFDAVCPRDVFDGALAAILDEVDIGVLMATAQGRVVYANRSALRACVRGRPCRLSNGHVQPGCARDAAAFDRALLQARSGRRSLLSFDFDGELTSLAFAPVQSDDDLQTSPCALLIFGRQEVCGPLSVQFFAREHGMTATESAVLAALCNGHSPQRIAADLGTAISTIRTHILKIREKIGVRSITDLLCVASRLPPLSLASV